MSSSSQIGSPATADGDSGVGEIILFGVRVVVDSMRKSVSLNNLSQYEQPPRDAAAKAGSDAPPQPPAPGYASENDVAHNSGGSRERKRGVPWTEEEHKLFLMGLQKVGKGDWRGISRNFVKTRTPTQVASHAQKYFLRRNNQNRRRRRSSLFDMTTDLVPAIPMEEEQVNNQYQHHQDTASESHNIPAEPCNPRSGGFSLVSAGPMTVDNPMENLTLGHKSPENSIIASSSNLVRPFALHSVPHGTGMADLNLNLKSTFDASSLSLKLSLPIGPRESSSTASSSSSARHPAFQSMPSFNNGDKIISVA